MIAARDLLAWALANGFQAVSGTAVESPLGEGKVRLEFLRRSVRVLYLGEKVSYRILTANLGSAHLRFDEHGFPEGIGIGVSLIHRLGGNVVPPWFPEPYRERLETYRELDRVF